MRGRLNRFNKPIEILNRFNIFMENGVMIPISSLFKDLYEDRWGNPRNSQPAEEAERGKRLFVLLPFTRRFISNRKRPDAWSFTIPVDRRLR
jgi:hypothetical protein